MEKDEIIIRKAIIHILDSTVGMPVLSDTLLELGEDLSDFFRGHIYKIATSDDIKKCYFNKEESFVYQKLEQFEESNLILFSQEICRFLYEIMNQNISIVPADMAVITYQWNSTLHLAFLKMNYKDSYVHFTAANESFGNSNDIMKQTATLPAAGSKLTEAVLINMNDLSVQLVEKKYDINGTKRNYFSELFLQCYTNMSSKTKLNLVTKAVEQINKKYFEDDFNKKMEVKSMIQDEIVEKGALQVKEIGERIYGDIPEIQEEFTEKLEKYHLEEEEVKPKNKQTIKKLEKQFLTTDTGIEINIPMEEYKNKENIEFITNLDGTISVLIKNINHIISK